MPWYFQILATGKGLKNYEDEAFCTGNEALSAVTTELKKLGKAKVNHHPEITQTDLEKLYNSLNITQPKDLPYKCRFDIVFFLVRSGRENLHKHKNSTFAVAVGSQSRKSVYKKLTSLIKITLLMILCMICHDGSMYEKPESVLCPVKCFELYYIVFVFIYSPNP